MGWFTSNLSGQPNLYPTKKNFENVDKHVPTEEEISRKEEKLYPTKNEYECKILEKPVKFLSPEK